MSKQFVCTEICYHYPNPKGDGRGEVKGRKGMGGGWKKRGGGEKI